MGAGPGRVPYTLTRTVWLVSYSGTQKSKLVVESKSTQTARPRPAPPRPRHWWASINILIITKVRFVQPLCSCRCPTLSIWNVTLEVKTIRLVNRYVTLINILLSLWYIFTTQGFHHVTNLWSCHAGPLMNIKMLWCFLTFLFTSKVYCTSMLLPTQIKEAVASNQPIIWEMSAWCHTVSAVRLCCRRKGYSLYLHQKLVVSCVECGGWWSGGVTINTRALIMFSVTTATRITHDSNLSMFGGDFLPTLGESPPHRAAAHKHHLFIST